MVDVVPANSLGWGFAFAFDLAATTLVLVGGVCSSCGSAGISDFSSSIESITYLTVPQEILTQEWELSLFTNSIRISIPYLKCWKLVVTSNTSPIFIVPWIHPFGWEAWSSLGKVYSRQATELNCLKSLVSLVTKYCPASTTRINPASLQNWLTLFSGESDSTCWMYCCQIIWSFMGLSFCKGASALISPRTIDCPNNITGSTDISWWLSNSSHLAATAP